MEQLLSSMLGPIARGLRDTNAFGNSGDIYTDTQYRGGPITMPAPSGGGFAANYTPIRFAPLVSLTGPVMAPATPAAPEVAAPMAPALRLPQMSDMPDNAYMTGGIPAYGGASIGNRSGAEIRGDLGRIGGFFMSPLATMASYAMTGKSPMELMSQGAQSPFGGFLQGLQDSFARNVFGPEEVPLFETRAPLEQAIPVSASDIQLQDLASALGISLPEAAAILGGQPAASPAGPVSTIGMDMFGPQETGGGFAPSDFGGAGITEGFTGDALGMGGGQAPY